MGRLLVIGDIHGNYQALKQCFDRCELDYENDEVICLGDIVDGFTQTYEVVEELLKVKNLILIKGNHDEFMTDYILKGRAIGGWIHQGGINTINSYLRNLNKDELLIESRLTHGNYNKDYSNLLNEFYLPVTHQEFFNNAVYYYEYNNKLFVHGGFNDEKPIKEQNPKMLMWDRNLIEKSRNYKIKQYDEVFVGHSTTQMYGGEDFVLPRQFNNLWMLDTGAGWNGKLTIMDVNTKEYWQSDKFNDRGKK